MVYTINNKPYLNLAANFDYDLLHREVTDLLILARDAFIYGTPEGGIARKKDGTRLLEDNFSSLTEEDHKRLATMDSRYRMAYMKIVKQSYFPWYVYPLNEMRHWDLRSEPRDKWLPHVERYMPNFIRAVESLEVFENIGWARIYANEAFNGVQVHYDSHTVPPAGPPVFDQFVYFNLNSKPVFLYDKDQHKKIFMREKLVYFDAANYHGTDAEPFFNYSVRVDGQFTKEFQKSLEFSRKTLPTHTLHQIPTEQSA